MRNFVGILVTVAMAAAVAPGCGSEAESTVPVPSLERQVAKLNIAGLKTDQREPMTTDAPDVPGAKYGEHFVVPEIAEESSDDAGGGIYVLPDEETFRTTAAYYAAFAGADLLSTWSCSNEEERVVIYLNGSGDRELAEKYCAVIGAKLVEAQGE